MANDVIVAPISLIDGVSGVTIYGANTNDWYIEYNPEAMPRHSITAQHIAQAIALYGYSVGLGAEATATEKSLPLLLTGPGINPKQWHTIEVANRNGRIITLGQIATVELREREPDGYFRINGQTAITLVVQSAIEANQIATANKVYAEVEKIKQSLPPGVELLYNV